MHPFLGTALAMPRMPTMGVPVKRLLGGLDLAAIPTLPSGPVVQLGALLGNHCRVAGTTPIIWWGGAPEGTLRIVEHTGAHVLTHNAARMINLGNADITVAAGDVTYWITKAIGVWKMLDWVPTGSVRATLSGTETLTNKTISNPLITNLANGVGIVPFSLGNITSFTINPANGNYQYGTNNGAATWTAPSSDCAVDIDVVNNGSAGTITFSGFTVGTTGDALTTTNTQKFKIMIRRINSVATYVVKALQ